MTATWGDLHKSTVFAWTFMVLIGAGAYGRKSWQQVTASATGSPCWFDLQPNGDLCAVCTSDGQQCGYPMHNRCRENKHGLNLKGWRHGCPGIARRTYTLSATGYPCPWDTSDRSCPWCSAEAVMCNKNGRIKCFGPSYAKSYFGSAYETSCKSQNCSASDPTNFGEACHPNASCEEFQYKQVRVGGGDFEFTDDTISRCVCKEGFVGNGVICANATTGVVFNDKSEGESRVRLNINLLKDATVQESLWEETPLGESTDEVYSATEQVSQTGHCNSTTAVCGTPQLVQSRRGLREEL